MKTSKCNYRTKLLQSISDRNFSNSIVNEIMHLFAPFSQEKKEQIAKAAISIVEQNKSETKTYINIREMIKQTQ